MNIGHESIKHTIRMIRKAILPKFTHISIDYNEEAHAWNYSLRGYERSVAGGDYSTLADVIEVVAKEFYGEL